MKELTIDEIINMLPTGRIVHRHDPKVILPPDCWRKEIPDIPNKQIRKKNNNSYRIFGKPKPNETMEDRAARLANGYKKVDEEKGMENNITGEYIVEHIFSNRCLKCGESDWRKLGCDRIDNNKGHLVDNVVCACRKCNIRRRTKLFEEFYM